MGNKNCCCCSVAKSRDSVTPSPPLTVGLQALLSSTIFQSLFKFKSIELVMLSNHLILCHPFLFAFNLSQDQGLLQWISSSYQVAKVLGLQLQTSVLPMNIQGWFSLGLTDLISSQPKGLSRLFCTTTVRKYQFFGAYSFQLSHPHIPLTIWTFVSKVMSLFSNMLSLS